MKTRQTRWQWISPIILLLLVLPMKSEEVKHYLDTRTENNATTFIDNFELNNLKMSFELPSQRWVYLENEDGTLGRFINRAEGECSIEMRLLPIDKMPENETEAFKLYWNEIQQMPSPNVDKGTCDIELQMECAFPRTFVLANTPKDRPSRIVTFFIQIPHLYQVTINFKDQLILQPRLDYLTMLRSFRTKIKSPSVAISNNNTEASSSIPTATLPNNSAQSVQQ